MKRLTFWVFFVCVLSSTAFGQEGEKNIAQYLQDISVTIKSGSSFSSATGSGVIITRELREDSESDIKHKVNFIITAAHVVDNSRSTRKVIDPEGREKNIVEFKDVKVVKELNENGRKVGQIEMDASVILYSDADNGEDLALLMMRKKGFVDVSAEFLLTEDKIIPIGTPLFHVGSLLGQAGANSMTTGIMSQVGRVLDLGNSGGKIFDQTTATAFPGSSGGGVFLAEGENKSKLIGVLVRGAGEGFNLIVPIRRVEKWAKLRGIMWILDPSEKTPTLKEVLKLKIEDPGADMTKTPRHEAGEPANAKFPFLIERNLLDLRDIPPYPVCEDESIMRTAT
jgi:hypothetical protein